MMTPSRWLLLGSLYVTQYLGQGFFMIALVAIMRRSGAPLEQIGLVYLMGLCWLAKPLWAHYVDRVRLGRLGHYRGWLLAAQAGMVATLAAIGQLDVVRDFYVVLALCLVLALLSATQDVAADGLACLLLAPGQRGLGNGVQSAGGLVGNILGGGAVLMAYPHVGWAGCLAILAGGTSLSLLQLLFFQEPAGPERATGDTARFRRIWLFWQEPGRKSWMLVLLLAPCGCGIGYGLITPMLTDGGWSMERIGLVMNVGGSLVGVLAAALAGWGVRRLPRRTVLVAVLAYQAVGLAALLPIAEAGIGSSGILISLTLFYLSPPAVMVIATTMIMDRASPQSPATDYTLQYSLFHAAGYASAGVSTVLAQYWGYSGATAAGVLAALAALLAALRLGRGPAPALSREAVVVPVPVSEKG
ncbi:MFS transporter [Solidesulfovibrio alcoholivorans]|uniref:MFS transporter n=1 Tax=Solidesulfovibrio alcoholivorans TaxID=81406 RepID=UPI000A00ECBF|nr:MFS transporter [Solidesulfovibrio alcoholivorans]